jgi:hypothetical protein
VDNTVVRTTTAPTEAEARTEAEPILDAFRAAGWELREALWIPGDRRPGLGESLLLSPASQLLLESDGTLRLTFANADAFAVVPDAVPAARPVDTFEEIGGVRYRRLVPRYAISIAVAIIGLIVFIAFASSIPNGPFAARPTPDGGICPVGWVPGMKIDSDGGLTPDGTCQQFNQ